MRFRSSRSSSEIERVKMGERRVGTAEVPVNGVGGQIALGGPGGGQAVDDIFLCHLAPAFQLPRLLVILCVCVY